MNEVVDITYDFAHSIFHVILIFLFQIVMYYTFQLRGEKHLTFDIMFYIHGLAQFDMLVRLATSENP